MSVHDDLIPLCKRLRLSGVLETIDLRIKQAVDDNLSHAEFLYRLLHDEAERRETIQLNLRIRRANFDSNKSIEDFDWHFNPSIPKNKVIDLATCQFIQRRENVLLVGKSGVGKSHLAQALGHRACRAGHTALFVSSQEMFTRMRASRADHSYERCVLNYTSPDLLIIDDLGLRPLEGDEPVDLYEVIRRRYERSSTIFTSNRDVDEWYPLFGDALLSSAAMDRLMHHVHILRITGKSYRNPEGENGEPV